MPTPASDLRLSFFCFCRRIRSAFTLCMSELPRNNKPALIVTAEIAAQNIQSSLCTSVKAEYIIAEIPQVVKMKPISIFRRNFFSCLLLMSVVLVSKRRKNRGKYQFVNTGWYQLHLRQLFLVLTN